MYDLLVEIALTSETLKYSIHGTSTEDGYYEGRITSGGNLHKAIRPGGGVSNVQNVRISFDDQDGYLKGKNAQETFKRKQVTIKLASLDTGVNTQFIGRIEKVNSRTGTFEIDVRDDSWDRLGEKITLKVFPDIFSDMPYTTPVSLIPIVLGTVSSASFNAKGAVPAYLVDPAQTETKYRYVAAQHPLKSIDNVYRNGELMDTDDWAVAYADMSTTEHGTVRMTFIDIDYDVRDGDIDEEAKITYDGTGLTDDNLESGTLLTNPADILENFLQLRSTLASGEFDSTLQAAAEAAYTSASLTGGYAVVEDGASWQDVIDDFAKAYNLQFFRTGAGKFGMIFDNAASGTAERTFRADQDIIEGSLNTDHPSDSAATMEFYYAKDHARNDWASKHYYNDSAEETILGRDVRETVELPAIRDINQGQKICQIKLFQKRSGRLLVDFTILPEPTLELGDYIALTHFGGEDASGAGYVDKDLRILELSLEISSNMVFQRIKAIDAPGLSLGSPADSEPTRDSTDPPPSRTQEIVSDIEFYAIDADTVGWTTGTVKNKSTGVEYSITPAGTTGNMTASTKYWIYFDPTQSTSALQLATRTLAGATGGTKWIMCIAYAATDFASYDVKVGFSRQGGSGGTTVARSVESSDEVRDDTIIADHINVATLSAIQVTTGSLNVTSGYGITVQSGGDITINDGGDLHLDGGGDIYLTPSDSDPSEIQFGTAGRMYSPVTGAGIGIFTLTDGSNTLALGDVNFRWNDIVAWADDYIQMYARISDTQRALIYMQSHASTSYIDIDIDGTSVLNLQEALIEFYTDIDLNTNYMQLTERSAPGAPAANQCRLYAADNGGKTTLYAIFNSGAAQPIAAEP